MKNKSILPRAFYALLAILANLTVLSGQGSLLFTETDWTPSELTQLQNDRLTRLATIYPQAGLWEVEFGAIENVQQNGRIEVEVPENEWGTVRFKAEIVEYNNSDDYLWYGEIEPYGELECECNEGSLMLIKRQDELFGTIRLEGKVYEIEPLSGNKSAIGEVPENMLNNAVCGVGSGNQNLTGGGDNEPVTSRENCNVVRVLFLHTPNAYGTIGNPNTAAESVIAATNIALNKSDVSWGNLFFILAGVEEVNIDETMMKPNQVLSAITFNQDAQDLRNQYGADIVVLFANRSIADFGTTAGIAWVGPSNSFAYGVVQSIGANSSFVASHEIGHIFGALHEPCDAIEAGDNCDDGGTFEHAHSFQFTKKKGVWPFCNTIIHTRKTIMFSEGSDEAIQHYSNPDVDFENVPTGITNARDNARLLKESACTVSGFRTLTPSLSVVLTGPYTGCVGDGVEVCAEIEGGTSSYTIKWYVADEDGLNYQYLPYNDNNVCLNYTFPTEIGERYWIKVVVSDGQGNADSAFHPLRATCSGGQGLVINPNGGTGVTVYPNPVSNGDIIFTFDLEEDAEVGFDVGLINGKKIAGQDLGLLPKGSYRYRSGIEVQSTQMLVLRVRKGSLVESIKFMVQR